MTKTMTPGVVRVDIPLATETRLGAAGLNILLIGLPFMWGGSMFLAAFNGTRLGASLAPYYTVALIVAGICLAAGSILSLAAWRRHRRQVKAARR